MPIGRRRTTSLIAAALAPFAARAVRAQDRVLRIVVPFTPGTGMDTLARILGPRLQALTGLPVVVDNKPGASGNIGTDAAARAAPDGNTLMMTANTFVTNVGLFKSIPYDPVASFAPVAMVATGDLALAVHPSSPATSLKTFVDLAKAKPGDLKYASPGPGTPQHLAMELFRLAVKIDVVHVPYKGSAGAVQDLVAGHVGAMVIPVHTALPLARTDKIRLLAVAAPKRSVFAPDVPTFAEAGIDGADVDLWYGLFAPAATPPSVVAALNGHVNAALAMADVQDALKQAGLAPVGGPADKLAAFVKSDLARWTRVIREAGIEPAT
ncbi:MAG: tripartite tricarboxylate transporter substrate binding protein [Rhodospirillales bacterium]|nr:MAG: tripartite tricarboxylate transporter substrate binding protein [Rhodospirillales bacterium]